jgi:hypothetical protein
VEYSVKGIILDKTLDLSSKCPKSRDLGNLVVKNGYSQRIYCLNSYCIYSKIPQKPALKIPLRCEGVPNGRGSPSAPTTTPSLRATPSNEGEF